MTKEKLVYYHRIYNIVLSIVIVIAGICLIAGCLSIYQSGDQPFSRESVAATFSGIAFPVFLCLIMTVISFLFEGLSPSEKEKTPIFKPYQALCERMLLNRDIANCEEALREEIMALQKKRSTHSIIRTIVLLVSGIIFLIYALNGNNFHQSEINSSMISAMIVLTPCLLVSFGYALYVSITNDKLFEKEIALIKQIPVSKQEQTEAKATNNTPKENLTRTVLIAAALFFMVYGFINGGTIDVLAKAINICTECIGLG